MKTPPASTYLIGEIGQNHNGSVDLAKLTIDLAARTVRDELFDIEFQGLNAIKMTRRDLKFELAESQKNAAYENENSFGKTYLAHREHLELSDEEHLEVFDYAKEKGLDFIETLCAPSCLSILDHFRPDYLKVASRDLTNLPLLAALAETKIPIILSTGMAGQTELDDALQVVTKYHQDISILHCVSQYPTHPGNVNLNSIKFLQDNYQQYQIGYSDHTIGISAPVAAVAMGAKIIEKHITIDRRMKGSDQAGSLGPDGVARMIRDVRLIEMSMGKEEISIVDGLNETRRKLERSIATKKRIEAGQAITEQDVHPLSPGDGYLWRQMGEVVGKLASRTIEANEIIYPGMLNK